jgi:small-conductance mechanosensitive channel
VPAMTDEKKENNIIKLLKMIREALFSPSPDDELYKPSKLLPGMVFYYLITVIVVIVVINLVLRYIGFDWSSLGF